MIICDLWVYKFTVLNLVRQQARSAVFRNQESNQEFSQDADKNSQLKSHRLISEDFVIFHLEALLQPTETLKLWNSSQSDSLWQFAKSEFEFLSAGFSTSFVLLNRLNWKRNHANSDWNLIRIGILSECSASDQNLRLRRSCQMSLSCGEFATFCL